MCDEAAFQIKIHFGVVHIRGRTVEKYLPKVLFDDPYQQATMRMYA
jgi:hypothetical protein